MAKFITIPIYADEQKGVNFDKTENLVFNIDLIVGFYSQYNEITMKDEVFFWTVDGGEYYSPMFLPEFTKLVN